MFDFVTPEESDIGGNAMFGAVLGGALGAIVMSVKSWRGKIGKQIEDEHDFLPQDCSELKKHRVYIRILQDLFHHAAAAPVFYSQMLTSIDYILLCQQAISDPQISVDYFLLDKLSRWWSMAAMFIEQFGTRVKEVYMNMPLEERRQQPVAFNMMTWDDTIRRLHHITYTSFQNTLRALQNRLAEVPPEQQE